MIQDSLVTMADDLAYGGTVTPVSLKTTGQGPGTPLYINFNGNGLVAATGFQILTGATSAACTDVIATHVIALATLNKGVSVQVPANVGKFVSIALTGSVSAGTFTASLSENQGQTNM